MPILEEETFEKFGFYSRDLKPHSGKKILVKCDECGKIREIRKCDYCSLCKSCAHKGDIPPIRNFPHTEETKKKMSKNHADFNGKNGPNWKGGKIKRICEICGKEFKTELCKARDGFGRFCSQKCMGIWFSEHRCGKNNPRWRGGKIKRICQTCGREFKVDPSVIKRGRGKYCSKKCGRKKQRLPRHHTKPELIFEEICKKYTLPFKYTGDGAFWIHNINPDFVECNGKKIAVEIFSYWHDPLRRLGNVRYSATYEGRKKTLRKYGWKLVVLWQEDLEREDAEVFVLNKLQKGGIIKEK